ncbi:hypothetical protein [Paenibacillus wenxiniae]|uniref:Uncharacterized protein n=1 Tax=Paenibacillus wenxiniae TaxID=1636843 RepID=A0ABW4RFR1_9BACL
MNDRMQRLRNDLKAGKMRGYSFYTDHKQSFDADNMTPNRLIQYAIQKRNHRYVAYYFQIDADQMDIYEDVATEEQREFSELEQALAYLVDQGADLTRFAPFKGQIPF